MARQTHFRFRTDGNAADATPTWGASEDATFNPDAGAFRLRVEVESNYFANAVHFESAGVTNFLTTSSLTAPASVSTLAFSLWYKIAPFSGYPVQFLVSDADNDPWSLAAVSSDSVDNPHHLSVFELVQWDTGSGAMHRATSTVFDNTWKHVMGAFDANGGKLYVSDVEDTHSMFDDYPYADQFPFDYTSLFNGKQFDAFGPFMTGDWADFWFDVGGTSLLDGSGNIAESTRRKFISATGKPVDLGSTGEKPTGNSPTIFMSGNHTKFPINKGTGGAFTLRGTITDATTSPSG